MPRRILVLSSLSWLATAILAAAPIAAQPVTPPPATRPAPPASAPAGTPPAPPARAGTPPAPAPQPAPGAPQSPAPGAPQPAPGAPQPAPGAPQPAPGAPQSPAPAPGAPQSPAPAPGAPQSPASPAPAAPGAPAGDAPAPEGSPPEPAGATPEPGAAEPPADAAPPAKTPAARRAGRWESMEDWSTSLPEAEQGPQPAPADDGALGGGAVPRGQRGAIGVETSAFTGGDSDVSGLAVALFARMPFADHTFLDVRVPFGLAMDERTDAVLGNVMLGAHHVARAGRKLWITVGGAVGLATLSAQTHDHRSYEPVGASRAYWDLHEYFPSILPIHARLGAEAHLGPLIARLQLEPLLYIPLGRNEEYEVAIQHAAELQIGHGIGGGVRVQGMALPTFDNVDIRHAVARNVYVLALEPFVAIERKAAFLRAGLLLPFDEELGPPLDHTWGFHLTAGVRTD
ncbi:hypothetical protein [Sorangium sp. So ce861]|uniref:hypothetical protein n=1 Tax=Sorangium sp. So ce861 TaxID=3133323 RepID=UPI003F60B512